MPFDDRPTRRHLLRGLVTGMAGAAAGVAVTSEPAAAASMPLLSETVNATSAPTEIQLQADPLNSPGTVLRLTHSDANPAPQLDGFVTIDSPAGTALRVRGAISGITATGRDWGAAIGGDGTGAVIASTAENAPCLALYPQAACRDPQIYADPNNNLGVLYVERVQLDQGALSPLQLWWGSQPIGDGWRRIAGPDTAGALTVLPVPVRAYDSRPNFVPDSVEKGPVQPGTPRTIDAKANNSGVPAHAKALAVNLTVTEGTADGYLVAYPAGQPTPPTSSINWSAGQTVANGLLVGLGLTESLTVSTTAPVHVIVDITGYYL